MLVFFCLILLQHENEATDVNGARELHVAIANSKFQRSLFPSSFSSSSSASSLFMLLLRYSAGSTSGLPLTSLPSAAVSSSAGEKERYEH